MPLTTELLGREDALAVLVTDHWVDEFCEHVGSLCAVLQALARVEGTDRPPALIVEALGDCTALQNLLNAIPVWGGQVVTNSTWAPITAGRVTSRPPTVVSPSAVLTDAQAAVVGDSFPEIAAEQFDQLPAVDKNSLEERCQHDVISMLTVLQKFRFRAEGDLRELELLSVGHDWPRLSRLAGVLKDAASQVSAYRIVVDAAALQGAARIGCRNDVDIALDALRSDLRDCAVQVTEWQATGDLN